MTAIARYETASATSTPDASGNLGGPTARRPSDALTLDELLAEPMVQQLMQRDRTDEATVRRLWQHIGARPPAPIPCCMPQRSRAAGPDAIARLLHEIARLWRRRCDKAVRARLPGMTCARCAVLIHLAQLGSGNQAALAHRLDITPITLVRLLDRLEANGLVARMPDPHDRRAHLLAPTAKALPLIACIYELAGRIEREAQVGLSDAEATQVHALLCRIRSNLAVGAGQLPSTDPARECSHA
jgi:MarR family transcriptional regulator, transcriptional regulator for hemolysin